MNPTLLTLTLSVLFSGTQVFGATELAKVNSRVLTLETFNQKYQESIKFFPMRPPTREAVLDDLVKRELAIQEARKMGLDKDPEIQERLDTVLFQGLLEKKLGKEFEKIYVTDDDAESFYKKNPEVRTSHIFVEVRAGASKEDEKKALEKITSINESQIKPGKMSFAEAAQKFSEGVAAPMGGDIDYQTKDRLDPVYYETAVQLREPGKVSGIIRTRFGFHIVKLTAVRSWSDVDRPRVKRLVFDERRQQIFDDYVRALRKGANVTIKSALLKGN